MRVAARRHLLIAAAALLVAATGPAAGETNETTVTIPVEGMACFLCAARVRSAVRALQGVLAVEVSAASGTARIRYAPGQVSLERIVAAIHETGFKPGVPAVEN